MVTVVTVSCIFCDFSTSRRTKALEAFFFSGGKKKHFSLDEKKKALFFFCVGFLVRRTCSHDFFDTLVVFLRWGQPRRQDF